MHVKARMLLKPRFDHRMLVGGVVVADQVQGFLFRRLAINLFEKGEPLGVPMALFAARNIITDGVVSVRGFAAWPSASGLFDAFASAGETSAWVSMHSVHRCSGCSRCGLGSSSGMLAWRAPHWSSGQGSLGSQQRFASRAHCIAPSMRQRSEVRGQPSAQPSCTQHCRCIATHSHLLLKIFYLFGWRLFAPFLR